MAQSDGEIRLKDCPLCKTPIAKTQRFMNIVKMIYHDVCRVKNRVFGNMKDIEASRDDLKKKLVLVHDHAKTMKGNVTNHHYIMTFGCLICLILVSSLNTCIVKSLYNS